MPIIPANWTGQQTINAVSSSGGGFPVYQFSKSLQITLTELDTFIDLIGICNESINRELSLDIISGRVKLFWKNKNLDNSYTQITRDDLTFDTNFVDLTLGQLGLSVKISEPTELFVVVRWDNDVNFDIYEEPIPEGIIIEVNGDIATFSNYQEIENFTVNLGSGFNYSGNPWAIMGYWYSPFYELFFNPDGINYSSFVKGWYYGLNSNNTTFTFGVNFSYVTQDGYSPVLQFVECYEDPEKGLIPNPNITLDVSYNQENNTFNISK